MSWLLKIVEGPMAGAEVALVTGTRIKVGSTDDCDIVIADATIPVFTLDVSESAVTLSTPSGETRVLKPFEINDQGTTALAVGPAEGAWKPLTRPAPEPEAPPEETSPTPKTEPDAVEPPPPAAEPETKPEPKSRRGCGCICAVMGVLLLLVVLALAWYFWPHVRDRYPTVAEKVETSVSTMQGWFKSVTAKKDPPAPVRGPTLAEIAQQYGLNLGEKDGRPQLTGNVRLRTERLAIRALALEENAQTLFDLTDDETLKTSSDELLFVVTEGALKAISASNRVVVLSGYAPNARELERAIRALNADVPGIERLETSAIQVGGTPPQAVAKTKFAAPGVKAAAPVAAAATAARRDYPIAGILTKPYPLVVMRNGLRLAEGAQVGTAIIERIEADKLILRDGKTTFEWKP